MRNKRGEKKADVICKTPYEIPATLIYFKFFFYEPVLDNIDPREDFLFANITVWSSQQMSSLSDACYPHLKLSNAWKEGWKVNLC